MTRPRASNAGPTASSSNDDNPDSADGTRYWETALVQHEHVVFAGCATPARDHPGDGPTPPATGGCPS